MLCTTTHTLENHPVKNYLGIVTGEVILGANFFKDFMAGITDFIGGRAGAYESTLQEARQNAQEEMEKRAMQMGANAVIAVQFCYSNVGETGGMLMVTCNGTAVVV
jgi:uncharacterized protein YbjQ (UPF0145 family)